MQESRIGSVSKNGWIAKRSQKVFNLMIISLMVILPVPQLLEPPAQIWVGALAITIFVSSIIPLTVAVVIKKRNANKDA